MKEKFVLAGLALAPLATFADTVTITPPVDISNYITAGVTALGTVVAAAVAGYCGFLIIRKGIKWIGRALN